MLGAAADRHVNGLDNYRTSDDKLHIRSQPTPTLPMALRQRQRDLPGVVRRVIEGMGEQPHARDRAEERRLNRLQPILVSRVRHEFLQHTVSTLDQLTALGKVVTLTRVDLSYRRVFDIRWRAQHLREQVHRLADVSKNEAD